MATSSLLGYTLTISPPLLIALRIAPLLSTTASMTHAYMEWLAMTSFLTPPNLDTRLARAMIAAAPPSTTTKKPTTNSSSTTKSSTTTSPSPHPSPAALTSAANLLIPRWFTTLFSTGLYSVITLNTLTLVSSLANLYLFPEGTRPLGAHRKFYITGFVAAVAHYAFVPLVGRSVGAMFGMCAEGERDRGEGVEGKGGEERKDGEEGRARAWVREWVGWHLWRWGSVDLVAWGSFGVGVLRVLV